MMGRWDWPVACKLYFHYDYVHFRPSARVPWRPGEFGRRGAQVIEKYKAARAKTMKFAEETELPLKEFTTVHPFPVFNTLNAYQWLIYIPLHNLRHDLQIAEVKASPGYPK